MEKKERAANLHASALRRELDRCLESAPPTMSEQTQRAEALAGRAQLAMTARNWADAIALFETALRELTQHPATLSPTASDLRDHAQDKLAAAADTTPTKSGAPDALPWYRVAMPALLRAGPSLSSLALERLEIGGVVQALQPEVECEGRRRLQVAGNVYGRGWCSLETPNGQPILRKIPSETNLGDTTLSPSASVLSRGSPTLDAATSAPKQEPVGEQEREHSPAMESRAEVPLSTEKDEAAAWRAEAVRREAARAEAKVRKQEEEAEALQVAEKAAETARVAQLRAYKEQAKRLEEARMHTSPKASSGHHSATMPPPSPAGTGVRTPSRSSSAAAARYAAVEPTLSATRPRNRWVSTREVEGNGKGADGSMEAGQQESAPSSARKASRAAAPVQVRRGGWRAEALRREAAMLGRNRRRRRKAEKSEQRQHTTSEEDANSDGATTEGGDDWRPRVNRALTMAEEAAAANASGLVDSDVGNQPHGISEAVTPPRRTQHEETTPPDSRDADSTRLHAGAELQRLSAEAADLVAARSRSSVMEAVEALKAEAEALATPQITPGGGKAAAFYRRFGGATAVGTSDAAPGNDENIVGASDAAPDNDESFGYENDGPSLSDAEYERELEALRKISADATREIAARQANRTAASGYGAAAEQGQVSNPMHASPYSSAAFDSPWLGSSHGAADE